MTGSSPPATMAFLLMLDLTNWLDAPRSLLLGFLRLLWWFAWEFWVETVGWTVGWCVLRTLSLGRFPQVRWRDLDEAGFAQALFVQLVGLGSLALCIWALSGAWPR